MIASYGLYNVFLNDFDKKVFKIKYTFKKLCFCLKPSKREVVTLLGKTLANFYFKILVYKQLQPKNEIKYAFSNFIIFSLFQCMYYMGLLCHLFFLIHTWTTYQMIQYTLSNSFVDDMFLSFITLINAKIELMN